MSVPVIACVGGGNMARALFLGSLRAGVTTAPQWIIAEPDAEKRDEFARAGAVTVASSREFAGRLHDSTQVLLAIKPQALWVAGPELAPAAAGRVVISILAGTPSAKVLAALPGSRVVRAMPNTPAQVGQGATAISLGAGARHNDDALAMTLFAAVGPVVERVDESLMDAFTAVAGSGPAYVFYVAQAMAEAAHALGFDRAVADRVVRQVILGSATLLAHSTDQTPAELRAAVTSKGGTTEAACRSLDDAHVMDAFVRALTAARDRGRELGR